MPLIAVDHELDYEDTSSEGREAIERTRVADEQNMVEVRENTCSRKEIILQEMGTQTEIETASVAVTAKPPTPPALLNSSS